MIKAIVIVVLLLVATECVVLPWWRIERQRRSSRNRRPRVGDSWHQDGQEILVTAVDEAGIELRSGELRWRDTWEEWRRRCAARVVIYSGRRAAISDELAPW